MVRRIDHVRTGQDRITDYLKEYGDRLNSGAIKDTDSLQFVIDLLEHPQVEIQISDP